MHTHTTKRIFNILAILIFTANLLVGVVPPVSAAGGAYSLKWYAADPAVDRAPYLPTYTKVPPSQMPCPTPTGGVGHAADPMKDAVAYGPTFAKNDLDAVTSLMPKNLALGQIVPFELEIAVTGSTAPENGVINVTPYWLTKVTNGGDFGFDPSYGIYCAFVDSADPGTTSATAKVDSWTSKTVNVGTSNEQIQGTIQISGLTNPSNVIVEIWVVLKNTIAPSIGGNVQTGLAAAQTGPINSKGDNINTGNQTVPLLQVGDFFSSNADVSITKSDIPDPVELGNQLTYTIVATNNSTDTIANGVVVTDTLDPNTTFVSGTWPLGTCTAASGVVTCNVGALAQGTSVTITIVVNVNTTAPTTNDPSTNPESGGAGITCPAGVDLCNKVTETAITSDPTPGNNSYFQPTNVLGAPALSLTKTASPTTYSAVGQTINYSYVLTNTGNVTLSGPFAVTDNKATVSCPATPTTLATNATLTCTASYVIAQGDLDAGSVINLATATASFNSKTVTSNQATATVTATQTKSLSLTKSATPSTYDAVGQTITYSYVIKNTGNVTLSGPFSITDDKATVTCTQPADGALSPNETMSCTASYTITQADLDASKVTNVATATNDTVTSNQATATVNAVAHPNLSLVKTATPATYSKVGDVVSYSYAVKNIGNVALSGPFAVADDKSTDESCPQPTSLAVGASITCTASYTITQADLDAGSVTNHATATATFGGNVVTSNQAQATVNAVQTRALTLDKTAQETTYAKVGDLLHYSYLVTNSGNVTLHDAVVVSDNKTAATCPGLPAGGLAPGASITCAASYTVTQADLDGGSVTNVASATSGTTISNTDTVTVNATQTPSLSLTKTASPATYSAAGQTISYSYVLKNTGNVTLSGPFVVTDDKATVTCPSVASLAVGDTLTCTASHTVTQAEVDTGSITNKATATATFGGNTVTSNEATATVTATQAPALSLTKSASPSTYDATGQMISYIYVLTNSGNVTLAGPFTVSDDKATVTCPATASLAPTASITCTASYTITQADLDAGKVTNIATGHASFGGNTVDSNQATQTVTALQQGGISLTKAADPTTYSVVGQKISYTYVVKNTGNVTLAGPFTVNDDIVGPVSCPAGSLAPNATVTCTATYTITQADLDAGSVTNKATATDGTLTSNQAQATVTAVQTRALAIDKTAQEATYSAVGNVIHYSYLVTNTGNVTLHDAIVVSDDKATDESCPALPAGGLAPGASITCTASYTITQADLDAGSLTNVASAASGSTVSPTDTVTVPATQSPALSLKKSANPLTYTTLGQTITYDYLLTNTGNVTLSSPFAVTDDKATVTCPAAVTSLAPGATLNCTATYTITQADLDSGSVTNVATATAKFGNTTVTSNQDTATVTANQNPALSLVKSASPSTYDAAGQTISYSYALKNTGNVTLAGPFTVIDDKASVTCPATSSMAPGASITCSASYIVTQADLDGGSVTNTATGHAAFGGNPVDSNPDSETVNAIQSPALSLVKTASPATYDTVGQSIAYSYEQKNIGNVTLAGPFTVSDDKATVTCPADATLAVGASLTCSATYAITQADLDAGSVTNIATGHAQTLGGTPVNSNNASATVNAVQKPALAIDKSAQEATYAAVGDIIHYSYLVTNTGNVTLHDAIVVSDNKTTASCPALPVEGLAPGASITCTATYTILQSDLDAGSLTNVASAASGTVVSPTDTVTVPATQAPALTIDKTAAETTYAKVGDVLHYSYLVTNSGNVTLYNITVTDNKAIVTCPDTLGGLAPAASITCTASYTITQADLDAGSVVNSAYAKSGDTQSPPDEVTVPATQTPALSLTKTALPHFSTPVKVGDIIDYTLTATNTGNITLSNVTITDALLPSLTCDKTAPVTLAPAEALTCTGTYAITQVDIDAGKVDNTGIATSDKTPPVETPHEELVPQSPHLTLTKAGVLDMSVVPPLERADVGDVINYTLTAINDGNQTLTGVSISDALLGTLVCTPSQPATLVPGASLVCTGSYTLTLADINAGNVHNVGIGDSDQTPPTDTPNDVPVPQAPALTIDKTASESTYSAVGNVIHYSYLVTNSGNVTLFNIGVTDDKATVTCPDTSAGLAPLGTITCNASYTITQADIDAGSVTNSAYAKTGDTQSPPDTVTVPATQTPHITIVKSVDENSFNAAGNILHYSLVATNDGNVTLSNVSISDPLLGALTCTPSQPTTLAPAATLTCTGSYTVQQSDVDAGHVANTATATGSFGGKEYTATDSKDVPAIQSPHLTLVKTATANFSTPVKVGDTISYSLIATNDGNVTLNNVNISDPLLPKLTCDKTAPVTLAPTEKLTCTGTYTLTQADIDSGHVANTAIATSKLPGGGDGPGGQDSNEVPVPQSPALTIDKTATPSTYSKVGDIISYSYLVTNSGNVTLPGPVTVTDDKAIVSCPAGGLAPGASMTCDASYTITQANLDAGKVTNSAYAMSGTTKSNTDTETVTAVQSPALSLTKAASPATYSAVGQTISYSYVVKNTGNVTLAGPFTVSDNKATVTCPATSSLAPGASITCSASYKVTQADLDAGSVTNKATATNGTVTSNEATATVTAVQSPAITLTKTANPTLYSKVGDVISYTLVAKNTGNVTLHDVSISDLKLGTLTCTQPATLAPNATLTCTGTYTIQASDLVAGQPNKVTNTATVNGKGPQDQPVSATASATVYQQTGALLPTQTTCQQYAAGPSAWPTMYTAFQYQVKSNKISSVSPGVIFYYNTITSPSASFNFTVGETNSLNWKPMLIQDLGQAILYNADCSKASGVTVTTTNNPYTVKFTVTGATPGATYFIGIKYSPQNLIGQAVKATGGVYPTSLYSFSTIGYQGGDTSIPVAPKK